MVTNSSNTSFSNYWTVKTADGKALSPEDLQEQWIQKYPPIDPSRSKVVNMVSRIANATTSSASFMWGWSGGLAWQYGAKPIANWTVVPAANWTVVPLATNAMKSFAVSKAKNSVGEQLAQQVTQALSVIAGEIARGNAPSPEHLSDLTALLFTRVIQAYIEESKKEGKDQIKDDDGVSSVVKAQEFLREFLLRLAPKIDSELESKYFLEGLPTNLVQHHIIPFLIDQTGIAALHELKKLKIYPSEEVNPLIESLSELINSESLVEKKSSIDLDSSEGREMIFRQEYKRLYPHSNLEENSFFLSYGPAFSEAEVFRRLKEDFQKLNHNIEESLHELDFGDEDIILPFTDTETKVEGELDSPQDIQKSVTREIDKLLNYLEDKHIRNSIRNKKENIGDSSFIIKAILPLINSEHNEDFLEKRKFLQEDLKELWTTKTASCFKIKELLNSPNLEEQYILEELKAAEEKATDSLRLFCQSADEALAEQLDALPFKRKYPHFLENFILPLVLADGKSVDTCLNNLRSGIGLDLMNNALRGHGGEKEDHIRHFLRVYVAQVLASQPGLDQNNKIRSLASGLAHLLDTVVMKESGLSQKYQLPPTICEFGLLPIAMQRTRTKHLRYLVHASTPAIDLALRQSKIYEELGLPGNFLESSVMPLFSSDGKATLQKLQGLLISLQPCIDKLMKSNDNAYPEQLYQRLITPILSAGTPVEFLEKMRELALDDQFTHYVDDYLSKNLPEDLAREINPSDNFYKNCIQSIAKSTSPEEALLATKTLITVIATPIDSFLNNNESLAPYLPCKNFMQSIFVPLWGKAENIQDCLAAGAITASKLWADPILNEVLKKLGITELKDLPSTYAGALINHNRLGGIEKELFSSVINDYNHFRYKEGGGRDACSWNELIRTYKQHKKALGDSSKVSETEKFAKAFSDQIINALWDDQFIADHPEKSARLNELSKPVCLDRFLCKDPDSFLSRLRKQKHNPQQREVIVAYTYEGQQFYFSRLMLNLHIKLAVMQVVGKVNHKFDSLSGETMEDKAIALFTEMLPSIGEHIGKLKEVREVGEDTRNHFIAQNFRKEALDIESLSQNLFSTLFENEGGDSTFILPSIAFDLVKELMLGKHIIPKAEDNIVYSVIQGAVDGAISHLDKEKDLPIIKKVISNAVTRFETNSTQVQATSKTIDLGSENSKKLTCPEWEGRLELIAEPLDKYVNSRAFKKTDFVQQLIFNPIKAFILHPFKSIFGSKANKTEKTAFQSALSEYLLDAISLRRPGLAHFLNRLPWLKSIALNIASKELEEILREVLRKELNPKEQGQHIDQILRLLRKEVLEKSTEAKEVYGNGRTQEQRLEDALTKIFLKLDFMGRHDSVLGLTGGFIACISKRVASACFLRFPAFTASLGSKLLKKSVRWMPLIGSPLESGIRTISQRVSSVWRSTSKWIRSIGSKKRERKAREEAKAIIDLYIDPKHDGILNKMVDWNIRKIFAIPGGAD
ncbi:MAG: hypothetical protein CMO81_01600 [Waddliaceae bacterium]|nr:hypothetical protein [Waddliaceae bacterium]